MTEPFAFFTRNADGSLTPTERASGAWSPEELHISPVNGVLMPELERWLDARGADDRRTSRVSLDYLGVLDFAPCTVEVRALRPGRAVELLEATLTQNGRAALVARIWRTSSYDSSSVSGGERDSLPHPDGFERWDMPALWPGAYVNDLDVRAIDGPHPGRATAWVSTPHAIVAGEPSSDLAHHVLLVDTANGIAVRARPEAWQYPNVDLTVHLFRQPVGRWIGFDTTVIFGATGQGLTTSDIYDERGHVGRAEQALIVRERT